MKPFAALLIVGVLAVGVFGFLGMNPMMDHESGNCIASLINVVACPLSGLSSAIYHMSAYASFSQAVFSSSLILLTLIALALLVILSASSLSPSPAPSYVTLSVRHLSSTTARHKFIGWLSFFENSPSVVRSI